MNVSIIIATYGDDDWQELALSRAYPSARAQGAPQVFNYHALGVGIAQARNEAVEHAEGDWLCFLDADDELAPGYLGAMRRALEQEERGANPDTTALLLTPAINRPGRFWPEQPLEKGNWLCIGTLISRALFNAVGGFGDYPHGLEDFSLWNKAHRMGARVVKVPDAVYIHHANPASKKARLWRDARAQVEAHNRVIRELDEWEKEHRANISS